MGSNRSNVPRRSLAGEPWLASQETRLVLAALTAKGAEARAVGGAVRNSLLGQPVKDIDIATTATPDEVIGLAAAAGLKAIATGIEHGTVTLIAHHVPYEVTTLRRDVETFGRHARVTYTTDWAEDAQRRDFTINALYCDASGTIHDPLGGLADIEARRVRFIGCAEDRIREDYLRILRFFRFTAEYAGGAPDAEGLQASRALAGGLDQLSAERIRAELLRLLAAPDGIRTALAMTAAGITGHVLPAPPDAPLLERLDAIEQALDRPPDPILRLAALSGAHAGVASKLRERLRLSNTEYERIARMTLRDTAFDPKTPEQQAKAFLYRMGTDAFTDAALIDWARSSAPPGDPQRRERIELPVRWQAPELPVRGTDVIKLGVEPGPGVGRALSAFEDWWIGAGFPSDPHTLAHALKRAAMVTKA